MVTPPLPTTSTVSSGADEGGSVFVETDADGKRVVGERRDQPAQPVPLAEMLVDDETVGEPQTRREPHAAGDHRGTLVAECNHVLAQDAGAGAGPPDRDAACIAHADELRHRCAAEQRRETQLIAAGEENTARLLEPLQPAGFLAIPAGVEIHHRDIGRAQVLEEFLVARSGFMHAARGRNHHDIGFRAAGHANEALQNVAVVFLIFGAADGYDPAASLAVGNFAWH